MTHQNDIRSNEVMQGEFASLMNHAGGKAPGPWRAACLSGHTGPTWVFVNDNGDVVPLTSVRQANRSDPVANT